jgi:hypothetical protein
MERKQKRRHTRRLLNVQACVLSGLVACAAWAQPARPVSWGVASNGLRMGISASGVSPAGGMTLDVLLENVGTDDFVLNLGHMLANGKVMFPDAVRLVLTRPDGSTCELHYADRRYPGVAGRVDDLLVALRGGSTYTLRLEGERLWCGETMAFQTNLARGEYRVAGRFKGQGAIAGQLDMRGATLLNFWMGVVESTSALFEVGAP